MSCPGSSVGRALGLESGELWVRIPPRVALFSLKKKGCSGFVELFAFALLITSLMTYVINDQTEAEA